MPNSAVFLIILEQKKGGLTHGQTAYRIAYLGSDPSTPST